MQIIERVLIAQRSDGKFLRLHEERNTTGYDFVDDPCLAKRIRPLKLNGPGNAMTVDENDLFNPHEAPYYFENSWRARELWLKDCIMVPYEITTTIEAVKL